jgi:starch synthase (maltosyl-transferring)
MRAADERPFASRHASEVPLDVDRPQAGFASWYEMFPRSATDDPTRHGTFADVVTRLPAVRAMGFDVLYFPPIHPIGTTNRKGRNNALRAEPGDVGSPYAIGRRAHEAVHPQLGTLDDFRNLVAAAKDNGLEIALGLRRAVFAQPSLAAPASGLVPLASRRLYPVRRKSSEEIRGHRQSRFHAKAAMPALWFARAMR